MCNSEESSIQNRRRCLQLVTTYTHPNGRLRRRVTTVSGAWHMDFAHMAPVASSFDQECAAVIIARLATQRLLEEVGLAARLQRSPCPTCCAGSTAR